MEHEPTYFVQSTFRDGRTPYRVDRLEPVLTANAEDWPRGWGTATMGYTTIKSRVTPAQERLTIGRVFGWVSQMFMPVVTLGLTLILAHAFSGEPSFVFDGTFSGSDGALASTWLTQGHFLICLSFLILALTNRAHGSVFTMVQLALTWAILGGVAWWMGGELASLQATGPIPGFGTSATFISALIVGQGLSVLAFDLTRGPKWWTAPLWGYLMGMVSFVLIFYLWRMGAEPDWMHRLTTDLTVKLVMLGLMLIPYYLLRSTIRPKPGYGGA